MRAILTSLALLLCAAPGFAAPAPQPKLEHPGDVALIEDSGKLIYRHFPTGVHLYINDRDGPDKASCLKNCAFAWPPLPVETGDKPMGDWTIVTREDGLKQWAYKKHPVYLLYHDSAAEPQGNNAEGVWHFLEP